MAYKWGIDLGGTKIEGVILDENNNLAVVERMRVATEQEKGYPHILNQINFLITQLSAKTGIKPDRIGMGTPGAIDSSSGVLKNCNTQCLIGQTIQKDIETLTGLQFRITNDANCFAMAETKMGIVQELDFVPKAVFGVIMGTGVGGGLVINGDIIDGLHGIGGEWGHNVLDPDGIACYCGKKGCVEKVIAGPALERYYREKSGTPLNLKGIYSNYLKGNDEFARETVEHLVANFGKAVSVLINIVDPEVIILGGGVNNIAEVAAGAKDAAIPYVFNNEVNTLFLRPKLGDSAGVFGAALLV